MVFFEDKTKYGSPCKFHGHGLISVPAERLARFEEVYQKVWDNLLRLPKPIQIYRQHIDDILDISSYVTKHADSEHEILVNLI